MLTRTIRPMTQTRDELGYGGVEMTLPLRRVMVRPPAADSVVAWRAFGWRGEPDAARIAEEHEGLRQQLADAGAEVVVAQTPVPMSPDAIYVFDPALVTNDGALLLRPGKEGRRAEVDAMAADFVEAGVPIAGRLEAPATVGGRRHALARLDDAPRRPRLPHEPGRGHRSGSGAARCRP